MTPEEFARWTEEHRLALQDDSEWDDRSELANLELIQFGEAKLDADDDMSDNSDGVAKSAGRSLSYSIPIFKEGALLHNGSVFRIEEDGHVNWHTRAPEHYLHNQSRHAGWSLNIEFQLRLRTNLVLVCKMLRSSTGRNANSDPWEVDVAGPSQCAKDHFDMILRGDILVFYGRKVWRHN